MGGAEVENFAGAFGDDGDVGGDQPTDAIRIGHGVEPVDNPGVFRGAWIDVHFGHAEVEHVATGVIVIAGVGDGDLLGLAARDATTVAMAGRLAVAGRWSQGNRTRGSHAGGDWDRAAGGSKPHWFN
jgi:hypothetical protein